MRKDRRKRGRWCSHLWLRMRWRSRNWGKCGVLLSSVTLIHLVFTPSVDFTQLKACCNPDIDRPYWEYTLLHTQAPMQNGWGCCLVSRINRREDNVLKKGSLGPTWLSAGITLGKHQGTIITPLTSPLIHSVLWGMCVKTYGEWGHGWHLCSNCENPLGMQKSYTDTKTLICMHTLCKTYVGSNPHL